MDDFVNWIVLALVLSVSLNFLFKTFFPKQHQQMDEERHERNRKLASLAGKCITPTTVKTFVKFLKW